MKINNLLRSRIGVIGIGYAGLPMALLFAEKYSVIGFDIDHTKVENLNNHYLQKGDLTSRLNIKFTFNDKDLEHCNIYIVVVPTPINSQFIPETKHLELASETVGKYLKYGDIVIYESTVYPGATEEICAPILEKSSGLILNKDFCLGYSPERISPGTNMDSAKEIIKITSGSTINAGKAVDKLYKSVITAGTHLVSSIKIAEFSKVVENSQRDVNIAFVNEISCIADTLGIDSNEVLNAAATKWNFHQYQPGLVGGHCIAIDPYYLLAKSKKNGYVPDLITAARKINENMANFIVNKLIKKIILNKIMLGKAKILVMGYTYKEDCDDFRNTKVKLLVQELYEYKVNVDVYDPWINQKKMKTKINLVNELKTNYYDAIVIAVGHTEFKKMGLTKIRLYAKLNNVIMDIKNLFPNEKELLRL